jgi:hypothetical protein
LAETALELVLAVNRCVHFLAPRLAETLFGGSEAAGAGGRPKGAWKVWLWMAPSALLGLGYFLFGPAHYFYSPILKVQAVNPHYGYADQMESMVGKNSNKNFTKKSKALSLARFSIW